VPALRDDMPPGREAKKTGGSNEPVFFYEMAGRLPFPGNTLAVIFYAEAL
jgi:hypothetical protein